MKSEFAAVSRRDAIRLIAATPASGAMLATSLPAAALAKPAISAADTVGRLPPESTTARHGLANLTAEHFEPLIGEKFTLAGDRVTLTEVRRGPESGGTFRQQFALTFSAPQQRSKPSVVPVSHPAIGRHELHVTQVQDNDGAALEICFS